MISGNLEYLMSSLPSLNFSDVEAYQFEVEHLMKQYAFNQQEDHNLMMILLDEASKFLNKSEFDFFKSVNMEGIYKNEFRTSPSKTVRAYALFVWQLKTELKDYRRSKGLDGSQDKSKYDFLMDLPADPLQAERELLNMHWEKLEELSIDHYSNLSALILYKLKLEVLQRFWSFDEEIGYQQFQQNLNLS